MSSFSSIQSSPARFVLVQSSTAQSSLPLLHSLISKHLQDKTSIILLLCTLYPPSKLADEDALTSSNVCVFDWTDEVPGFIVEINWDARLSAVERVLKEDTHRPVSIVVDSVDTIVSDLESSSKAYQFLQNILRLLSPTPQTQKSTSANGKGRHQSQSRLIAHTLALCPLLPQLKQPRFSSSLTHVKAHPPALLAHIAHAYLTSPPLSSSAESDADALKFWRVFVPISERPLEIEKLVYGAQNLLPGNQSDISMSSCMGNGGLSDDFVVEIITRHRGGASSLPASVASSVVAPRRKNTGVERVLEGWSSVRGESIPLQELKCLKGLWRGIGNGNRAVQEEPDPTRNLTFNLSLTESQQASRAQVPLPYEHDGKKLDAPPPQGQILYDPDSADDLDDEDPDEDLDL